MTLLIAEKPSVAAEIAKVVGATENKNGYKIGNGYVVSWCIGHLVELAKPEVYDSSYKTWDINALPIVPERFMTEVSAKTAVQFRTLKALMEDSSITDLIVATDAGREGELIFRLVYEQAGCRKPFRRLWISSMEEKSIRDGLNNMKDGTAYDALYRAARCRQRADWLYGINLTRLYSQRYGALLPCGRVQTPTVGLIVQRQKEMEHFVPQTYYVLNADFGSFEAQCKVQTQEQAEQIVQRCTGKQATVTLVQREQKTEKAPALYDLTTLQRDANRLLGYPAKQTLDCLQSLYDNKLATYPRTDSRYITNDQAQSTCLLLDTLLRAQVLSLPNYDVQRVNILQVVNDKKVTDHHAVLPTTLVTPQRMEELPIEQRNILILVLLRLFCAVYEPHTYATTKVEVACDHINFQAIGKQEIDLGYLAFEQLSKQLIGIKQQNKDEPRKVRDLPSLEQGELLMVQKVVPQAKKTKPPKPYTEDTLLAAMENAGKALQDQTLREAMRGSGLGTPATRAGIIENIIKMGYVVREGKALLPTSKAQAFLSVVAKPLTDTELTAMWEQQLADIEHGQYEEQAFMKGITAMLRTIVRDTLAQDAPNKDVFQSNTQQTVGQCPKCGGTVIQIHTKPKTKGECAKTYFVCSKEKSECGFILSEIVAGKKLSRTQIQKLLQNGKTDLIDGFISRSGKPFKARLILNNDFSVGFLFDKKK